MSGVGSSVPVIYATQTGISEEFAELLQGESQSADINPGGPVLEPVDIATYVQNYLQFGNLLSNLL